MKEKLRRSREKHALDEKETSFQREMSFVHAILSLHSERGALKGEWKCPLCSIYVTRENCEKGIELFENALRLFHEENWYLDPWIINLSKTRYSNSKARDNGGHCQVFSFDFDFVIVIRFEFLNSNDLSLLYVDHAKFPFNKIKSTIKTCFTSYSTRAHPCINIYPIRSEETFSFPITLHRDHLRRAIIGLDGIDREEEFVKKERRERGAAQMRPIPLPESVIK